MKKILFACIFIMMMAMMTFSAYAETLPVKKAEIFSKNCIIVLRENGDLLLGDSIDTQSPKILARDVTDYKAKYSYRFEIMALHSDGKITEISISNYGETNEEITTETLKANAEKIYSIGGALGYLTKHHELKYRCNAGVFSCMVNIDNIKKLCYGTASWGPIYAISIDNTLYCYEISSNEKVTKTEILTEVNDCIGTKGNNILVLRNNCDLYFIKQGETPERIGTNIESMEKVAFGDDCIDYVNRNGEYYSGSTKKAYTKYMDNVRDIRIVGGYKYIITNDNVLYKCNSNVGIVNMSTKKNVKDVLGFSDMNGYAHFYVGTNGALYNDKMRFYMVDIADVIWYEPTWGNEDRYLYLTKNGELWGAFDDSPISMFITSFCQKPTIVEINKKEIKLTAKIQMVNNRSMYPFRECLESMGATVLWDSVNKIAIGEYNGNTIEFPIDSNRYYINGVSHEMDIKSYIDNSIGRTYIPIRYAAEGLGFTVDWIEGDTENIIKIYK